jgi:hypothetical protein
MKTSHFNLLFMNGMFFFILKGDIGPPGMPGLQGLRGKKVLKFI